MNKLFTLVKRYNSPAKSKGFTKISEIPASKKWAEYSVDEFKIRELMKGVDFMDKFVAEKALIVIRRKIEYMYKHENFNLSEATSMYKKLKRLSA
jgi:hypothetical protein